MTATAVPRGTRPAAPRPVASLDDILLELIDIDDNVRDDVGSLEELQASIAELGVLSPVKVTSQPDGRYRLVYGQRRVLACRALGRLKISAIVEPASDVDQVGARRSIEQLAENLQRKDLNPIEEAVALREVLDADPTLTQEALADQLAMSRPWVSNTLRLLKADPIVQEGVRDGSISASHAKSLVVLPEADQRKLAERIKTGMSSHALENEISWRVDEVKRREATATRTEKAIPKAIAALEAAGVDKDTTVALSHSYNLDNDRVIAAVKKAGWTLGTSTYGRGRDAKCDCKAVRLEFNRKWQVEPACVDSRHVDRQRNVDHVAEREREERIEARLVVLRARIRELIEPLPAEVLLLVTSVNYHAIGQADLANLDQAALTDEAADDLARTVSPLHAWGEYRAPAEERFEAIMAALGCVLPVIEAPELAPAKKGRKAAAG